MRSDQTGEIMLWDHFGGPVAALTLADYRGIGHKEVVCISQSGEGTCSTGV